jgi:hypothetical protein
LSHGRENLLPPPQLGEVRNPKGINQYTYRRQAEMDLERWCRTHGRELIEKILDLALLGKPWAVKLMLDRILPVVQKHEIQLPEVSDASIEAVIDRFIASVESEVPAKPNGNGAATS